MKNSKNIVDDMPAAVQSCHELLAWIIPQLDRMPRLRRYTLGERLETLLIHVLENLVEASYTQSRSNLLKRANTRLDTARHLWRLAHRLDAISLKAYGKGSEHMVTLGRQIGGWRKVASA